MAENIDPQLVSLLAGGGIGSDARMPVAPVQRDPRMERQIQVWTMSGRQPTPEMDAYLRAIAPEKEERGERLSSLARELSGVPQMGRAGSAIGEAAQDPSIPNVTNAAFQTGIAAFRPAMALKSLGAGYAGAVASDLGAFDSGAEAQMAKGSTKLPGLTPEQQTIYDTTQNRIARNRYRNDEELDQLKMTLQDLRDISKDFSKTQNAARVGTESQAAAQKQGEFDRAVTNAEQLRDKEFARDKRFSDTVTGQLYDKTGGIAPGLVAALTGGLSRAATGGGSGPVTSGMYNYGLPAALGTGAGVAGANLPLAYNAVYTEPDNPRKRGYEAYSENLPPDHPRKAEFEAYAKGLPTANPVREAASAELYDPQKFKERAILGGIEGVTGGLLGADAVRAASRGGGALSGLGSWMSQLVRGGPRGQQSSSAKSGSAIGDSLPAEGSVLPPSTAGAMTSGPTRPAGATGPNEELVRTLSQGQLPAPSTAPSSDLVRTLASSPRRQAATSNRPTWASDPPEGVKLDKGYHWDATVGRQRHESGGFGPTPKYSVPRGKKEASPPEKPGVQVDDTRPLRYPSED